VAAVQARQAALAIARRTLDDTVVRAWHDGRVVGLIKRAQTNLELATRTAERLRPPPPKSVPARSMPALTIPMQISLARATASRKTSFALGPPVAIDRPGLGAAERHAEMLKLDDRGNRLAAHEFDRILVAKPVGAPDRVVHVPARGVGGISQLQLESIESNLANALRM
jgi:hypothetical protein